MFYTFIQNNSGGRYKGDYGVIIIQANTPEAANVRALDFGIYFDGVRNGLDCECCGDRWGRASEWSESEDLSLFGDPLDACTSRAARINVLVVYQDGREVVYPESK